MSFIMQGQNLDKYLQERQHAPRQRHKQKPKRKLDEMLINYHLSAFTAVVWRGFRWRLGEVETTLIAFNRKL